MKISLNNKIKEKKDDYINSLLTLTNKEMKFINGEENEKNKISIINIIYKNVKSNNKKNQLKNREKILLIKREFIFYNLIILFFVQNIIKIYCQNTIISKDSIITLRVSQNGIQKIFNNGTKPDEIWIDDEQQSINKSYNLITTNIIKLIWTHNITNCYQMFLGCNSIIEMNFTKFDATKCERLDGIFRNCHSLISLDLSGFITSNVLNRMSNMFWNCYSLISLNLSTFDTSNVVNFGHIFCNCKSLASIDVSNFRTRKVKYIDNMFNGCIKLNYLNLSNFITTNVIFMDYMFNGCEELKIIDFPNFDVTSVSNINSSNNIFLNCKNLEYINIKI